jgi:hypothetical protein
MASSEHWMDVDYRIPELVSVVVGSGAWKKQPARCGVSASEEPAEPPLSE